MSLLRHARRYAADPSRWPQPPLREENAPVGGRVIAAGTGRQFGARHVHRVRNDWLEPAISIHVYAAALSSLTRYDLVDGALRVRGVERAGADW